MGPRLPMFYLPDRYITDAEVLADGRHGDAVFYHLANDRNVLGFQFTAPTPLSARLKSVGNLMIDVFLSRGPLQIIRAVISLVGVFMVHLVLRIRRIAVKCITHQLVDFFGDTEIVNVQSHRHISIHVRCSGNQAVRPSALSFSQPLHASVGASGISRILRNWMPFFARQVYNLWLRIVAAILSVGAFPARLSGRTALASFIKIELFDRLRAVARRAQILGYNRVSHFANTSVIQNLIRAIEGLHLSLARPLHYTTNPYKINVLSSKDLIFS